MFHFVFCGILATYFAYLSQFKGKKYFLVLSLAVIAYIMGLQDGAAIDFVGYEQTFTEIMQGKKNYGFLNLEGRHSDGVIEIGWYTLNKLLGNIIDSYHLVSLVASIFICCTIYKLLKNVDSKWHWLSILYYYFIAMQFCMSGIRQAMAMMCFLLATLFIIERKWKKLLLFSILGLTFHNSFIIFLCILPLLFIPDNFIEKHIKKICIICAIAYILVLLQSNSIRLFLIEEFMSKMEENASDYDHYLVTIQIAKTSFLNTTFRLLNFSFILFAFYHAKAKERKLLMYFLFATYAIAIVGENSDVARINEYFNIFSIVAMSIIPSAIKNKNIRTAFVAFTIIYVIKIAIDRTDSYLFNGYLDFHTILF